MIDDAVQRFAESFAADVQDGLTTDMPFSAGTFTRRLGEAGHLEGAFDLHQEGRLGNAGYRIDGYAFDEEGFRLDLFTTLYFSETVPPRVPAAEMTRAFERALRFASACVDGLASRTRTIKYRRKRSGASHRGGSIQSARDPRSASDRRHSRRWRTCLK